MGYLLDRAVPTPAKRGLLPLVTPDRAAAADLAAAASDPVRASRRKVVWRRGSGLTALDRRPARFASAIVT